MDQNGISAWRDRRTPAADLTLPLAAIIGGCSVRDLMSSDV
jgi:hypothetical protein